MNGMEYYPFLVFYKNLPSGHERYFLKYHVNKIDKVYQMYWRFLSCAMLLKRGGDKNNQTNEELVENTNLAITHHRMNFDMDVEVLAKR